MSISINAGAYLLGDIFKSTSTETLTYAESDDDKKDAALNYANNIIKGIEKEYNKSNESIDRGILNASELKMVSTKYEDSLAELNLDDKEGLSKEELASYILAADGLTRIQDEKYVGWEFLPDADITEEDLKKTVFNETILDGVIDEDNIFALENFATSDLKVSAQEIYDENFKKDDHFFAALVNVLFIH